jgi:hypothetical protein
MKVKNIIAFGLALAMCVPVASAIPNLSSVTTVEVSADDTKMTEDGFPYVIFDEDTDEPYVAVGRSVSGYAGTETNVVIPSEIEGYPVKAIYTGLFEGYKTIGDLDNKNYESHRAIESVTIPDTVTAIYGDAFNICPGLKEVNIPNSVTYIGAYVFFQCTALTSITFPDSLTTISACICNDCTALEEINLPNSITSIEMHAFSGCTALKEVIIPSSVTSIDKGAFNDCTNLETVVIKSPNTVIDEEAFVGCDKLTIVYDYDQDEEEEVPTIGTSTTTDTSNYIYDVNQDGEENALDLLALKKHLLGII